MSRTGPLHRNIATTYNTYSLNTFSWSTDIGGLQREFYKGIHYSVNIDSYIMFTSVESIWSKEGNLCKNLLRIYVYLRNLVKQSLFEKKKKGGGVIFERNCGAELVGGFI